MRAHLRHARIAPKKANLIAELVRKRSVNDALSLLEKFPKKGAALLSGVIASAAANAERQSQDRSALFIKYLVVQKGPGLKRSIPMARGRARPINKWTSHISVELGVIVPLRQGSGQAPGGKKGVEGVKVKKVKEVKKKIENVEKVEGPDVSHGLATPGTPHGDDLHSKGFSPKESPKGPTFQPHRRGGRGS
jgi:large subunit ribosomal protein L22